MINEFYKDRLSGGLADKLVPLDFNPEALAKGIRVEMEHTNDPKMAREIAMDHLAEDPKYYHKLEKMESGLEEVRLVIRAIIEEGWSQHLDNVMDSGDELPWDNDEPGSDDDDPNNPANIYKDANNGLRKVKPSVPGNQRGGIGRGSGPPGGGRMPCGPRQ